MIWFDIKNLERKISNNELSDKDGFNYVLAFFILTAISFSIGNSNSSGITQCSQCLISVIINIWGLKKVYHLNNEIDGKDFFKRFFAINWVIGMRLLIISIILGIILGTIIGIISIKGDININDPNPIKDILILIIATIYNIISYLFVFNSFRKIIIIEK